MSLPLYRPLRVIVFLLLLRTPQAIQVVVPSMGESITEGAIASVLVKEGQSIKENDLVAQIGRWCAVPH